MRDIVSPSMNQQQIQDFLMKETRMCFCEQVRGSHSGCPGERVRLIKIKKAHVENRLKTI